MAESEFAIASLKCLKGEYRFTPYLENLKVKDRGSAPRMISIPVVRDRVILSQLNKLIRLAFPAESKTHLAAEYVREIATYLLGAPFGDVWVCSRDIRKFYDSIDRNKLKKILSTRLKDHQLILKLLMSAVETPTVPSIYRKSDLKKYRQAFGVPQGLAISNALAAIYMSGVDEAMKCMPVKYYRFVDDVLLIGGKDETAKAAKSFDARVRARKLSVHRAGEKKGGHVPVASSFSYLGYIFNPPLITVRQTTIEKLVHSMAAKITDFKYNREKTLQRKPYLTPEMLKDAFLDELNERITGAISDKRRYGWIAYFSQINDEKILHHVDQVVRGIASRDALLSPDIDRIKRFSRAYFEMKYRPHAGYVRDYDKFVTPVQMLNFLVFRGQVDWHSTLSEEQIRERFEQYKEHQLSLMLADEASMY